MTDVAIVGGGPAGAAAGRLLALWGHNVVLLDKGNDPARGLAESIPPSTHKLLDQIGIRAAIDRAGFFRTTGNTVWWESHQRRVERFSADGSALGYQVFRPAFDRVLLDCARAAGADVRERAQVRSATVDSDHARVDFEHRGERASITARFLLDCSGRAGIVARRYRIVEPGQRTFALVGVWQRPADAAWDLPDETHTVVETYVDGWAWSVPISSAIRHCGVMAGEKDASGDDRSVGAAYRRALANATQVARLVRGATLERVFACDASLYSSSQYAGPRHLLVGDAGSFIDPLSSFGVKKALASAWMAAVATHTALEHPERAPVALEYFADWERQTYESQLRRTREFAAGARAVHESTYWNRRTDLPRTIDQQVDLAADPAVGRAFEAFKAASRIDLVLSESAAVEQKPVIRGHEIVLEPALAGGLRFVANVDLLTLAHLAPHHAQVPDLFEAYCRTCSPVPLPSVVGGLSLLVARGILHERV